MTSAKVLWRTVDSGFPSVKDFFCFENPCKTKTKLRWCLAGDLFGSQIPVVTRICDPNKSGARHHRSLKLGSKLKYLKDKMIYKYHDTHSNRSKDVINQHFRFCYSLSKYGIIVSPFRFSVLIVVFSRPD